VTLWNIFQVESNTEHIILVILLCLLCSTCCLVSLTIFLVGEELGLIVASTPTPIPTYTYTPMPPTETPILTSTPVPTSTQTQIPTQTPTSTNTPVPTYVPTTLPTKAIPSPRPSPTTIYAICNCFGPDLNCKDFSTHTKAQACFVYCNSIGFSDVFGLDRDNDGSACEDLP
jgi:hypothetical protein